MQFPDERLDPVAPPYPPSVPNSALLPDWSSTSTPSPKGGVANHHMMTSSSTPPTYNPNVVVQPHGYGFSLPGGAATMPTTTTALSSSLPSTFSPIIEGGLTPERFQQPVNMLNSFQQGYLGGFPASQGHVIPASAHVTSSSIVAKENPPQSVASNLAAAVPPATTTTTCATAAPPGQNFMSPHGTKLESVVAGDSARRRQPSVSGPPLDDQGTVV